MKNFTFKCMAAAALVFGAGAEARAQAYTENFDDITTLTASGWFQQNNSAPAGTNPVWFQGTSVAAGGPFDAYNGAANAYVACNYNSTAGGTGVISNWLVTPNRTLRNGDVFAFYTRKDSPDQYPDRLEVRMSTNGASTNVGTGATATGDFNTLLLSVNPSLVTGVYPTTWTLYTITISGLPAPTSGRIAFRYYVTGAGPTGTNSDYIGVDNVVYTPYVCPTLSVAPTTVPDATAGTAYSQSLSQTGALGTPSYAITAGALPPGMSLSASGNLSGTPTATGTFNFTVSVSDASGCAGSTAYTISVACPNYTFGGMFSNGTAGTSYTYTPSITGGLGTMNYTISGGALPPGLSLDAATGTVSGIPTATGTFNFTIMATDMNSCSGSSAYSITVDCPTNGASLLLAQHSVCSNAGIVALSGGSPAGGIYSGNGVSGTDFDPAAGSQPILYTLIDAYGCTQLANDSITVNAAPVVTANASAMTLCEGAPEMLSGSGADTYTWDNGVTDSIAFSASTDTTTYTVIGTVTATGCSDTASVTITVNPLPVVDLVLSPAMLCSTGGVTALSGGTPAGGVYSGTSVSGGMFDPTAAGIGSYVIQYSYSDANGCSATDTASITVSDCTGLGSIAAGGHVSVYPNPSQGAFTVEFSQSKAGKVTVRITDLQGKLVIADQLADFAGDYKNSFDLKGFDKGMYLLEVTGSNTHFAGKIILE